MNKEEKQQIAHELGEEGFDKLWRSYGNLIGTVNDSSMTERFKQLVVGHLRACLAVARHLGMEREVRDISQAIEDWMDA